MNNAKIDIMDRRKFLKASMFGVGATMLGVPEIVAKNSGLKI